MTGMEFKYRFDEQSPVITVSLSSEATLTEVVEIFERFLKAVGYCFDGNLEIVEETTNG